MVPRMNNSGMSKVSLSFPHCNCHITLRR